MSTREAGGAVVRQSEILPVDIYTLLQKFGSKVPAMSFVHRVPVGQLCRDVVVMLVISTLTKWKQEDLEFKVILGLIASSNLPGL